jgi:hypothetical protein
MAYVGFEGDYVELEANVRDAMLSLSGLSAGEVHLELGSGSGHFVTAALALGADSYGWEINEDRYNSSAEKSRITHGDILTSSLKTNDIRSADVITFWFTEPVGTYQLMAKLYQGMSSGTRLVLLYNSVREFKNGIEQVVPKNWNMDNTFWEPVTSQWVEGNQIHLFVR